MLNRTPFLFIISAPSGTGKTTLCRELVKADPGIKYSVSATTRSRRGKEEHGKDYLFLTEDEFRELERDGGLLEHEEVYGYLYGTPKAHVFEHMDHGYDVIFDLDIKGALNLKNTQKESVTVFVLPPSISELHRRLSVRARDTEEIIADRLAKAKDEIAKAREFDYVVVNDVLNECVKTLSAILAAERSRTKRIKEISIKED